MKRLIILASVAVFLVALPASHLLMAGAGGSNGGGDDDDDDGNNKVTICHLTPPRNSGNADRTGVIITVSRNSRNGHIKHGDCVRFRERDGKCRCRPRRPRPPR